MDGCFDEDAFRIKKILTDINVDEKNQKLWKQKIKKGMCTVLAWHHENVNIVKIIYSYKFDFGGNC